MIKYSDICSKRTYKTKDGNEKTVWLKIGTFKEMDDGKKFIELNMLPNTPFYVFPQKKDDQNEFGG